MTEIIILYHRMQQVFKMFAFIIWFQNSKGSLYEASIKELLEAQVGTSESIFLIHSSGSQSNEMGLEPQDLPPRWVICGSDATIPKSYKLATNKCSQHGPIFCFSLIQLTRQKSLQFICKKRVYIYKSKPSSFLSKYFINHGNIESEFLHTRSLVELSKKEFSSSF